MFLSLKSQAQVDALLGSSAGGFVRSSVLVKQSQLTTLICMIKKQISSWWQLKHLLFSPLFGEDSHFD